MMTVQEVAKAVMRATHMTQAQVAEKAGLGSQGTVGMYLNSKSMQVQSLLNILNSCGYELVARSGNGEGPEFVIGENLSEKHRQTEDDRIAELVRKAVAEELAKRG